MLVAEAQWLSAWDIIAGGAVGTSTCCHDSTFRLKVFYRPSKVYEAQLTLTMPFAGTKEAHPEAHNPLHLQDSNHQTPNHECRHISARGAELPTKQEDAGVEDQR